MNKFELREKYRLEWENNVINKISAGWLKMEAQDWADERLMEKYGYEEDDED